MFSLLYIVGFLAVANAQSGSLECYDFDTYGDGDNGYAVVTCECQVEELGRFLNHLGYQCFEDGLIPADDENGYFCNGKWNKCNQYQNCECYQNDNVEPEQQFWCDCLGSYLTKYGKFADGCWIPLLSESMREVAGSSMEAAWDGNGCEWFDFQENRVVPDDVAIAFTDGSDEVGQFSVTTNTNTWQSVVNLQFDFEEMRTQYETATNTTLTCAEVDDNNNGDDDGDNQEEEEEEWELAWEIRTAWKHTTTGVNGTETHYGDECTQDYTGDVFVGWSYASEVDGDGYVEMAEREVFIGDMSEESPIECNIANNNGYYNNDNNNGNNKQGWCTINPDDGDNDNNNNYQDSAEIDAALASAFAYKFYNKDDIDQYSVVISCALEAASEEDNNNNNNNNQSEECMYEQQDACEAVKTKYATPIMCANFFVGLDVDNSDIPDATPGVCAGEDGKDLECEACSGGVYDNESDCQTAGGAWSATPADDISASSCTFANIDNETECNSAGHDWSGGQCRGSTSAYADQDSCEADGGTWATIGNGNGDGGDGGGSGGDGEGMDGGDGNGEGGNVGAEDDTMGTVKTVAIIILALASTAFCCLWFTQRQKGGASAQETTPLANGQQQQL